VRLLDLFSGERGWSDPWKAAGHVVFTVDFDPRFAPDLVADIGDRRRVLASLPWRPDVILASPPCTAFTVMQIGRNWHHDGQPKTEKAAEALGLVWSTRTLITQLQPAYWIMENPVGKLRKLHPVADLERRTVTYCQFGEQRMKPTDLWSDRWPPSLVLPAPCRAGDPCHVRAPRGSKTPGSTQGQGSSAERSKIPAALSLMVMEACERDLATREPKRPLSLWGWT
jgi:hypothetical protein